MSIPLDVYRHERVVCVCGFYTQRKRREDGTHGVCRRCGSVLKPAQKQAEKRRLKAKAELEAYER
jgi:hypothetical protein